MKGQGSKLFLVTIVFLLLAGACAAPPPPPTPTPISPTPIPIPPTAVPPTSTPKPAAAEPMSEAEKLAQTLADAFNQRDLDAALALFVDEGLTYFGGSNDIHDKEAVRSSWESGIGLGETLELIDCGPAGEALRCTALVRNAYCYKAWCGLDLYHSEMTLRTKEGKIQLMTFRDGLVTAEDRKACNEAWPKYAAWAGANRAEEWKKLNAPAAYDLKGRPLGELESSLCKAYLEATKK